MPLLSHRRYRRYYNQRSISGQAETSSIQTNQHHSIVRTSELNNKKEPARSTRASL